VLATLGLIGVAPSSAATYGAPTPINVIVSGANGEGRIETPGRSCADGGQGAYWNYDYGARLAGGVFSSLPGDVRMHLALHSDTVRFPNTGPAVVGGNAFLLGTESHASIGNDRGTLRVRMSSGNCDAPSLTFDGTTAAGAGSWVVESGQGSYRDATGSGTFNVTAAVAPGADNPFNLTLAGAVSVLQPNLQVEVLKTYWGSLGTDYLTRRVTVVYRITNTGPGDAFNAQVLTTTPNTGGVTALGGANLPLGDLEPGDSEVHHVRFQLALLGPPCQLIVLNCAFVTTTKVQWNDALDVVTTPSASNAAKAPNLPPPL
jgi:hypothetical protein